MTGKKLFIRSDAEQTKLLAIVFLSGVIVMGVELLAGRLLAPNFGDSVLIWGSIIGSVLLAMSLGYWLAGVLADAYNPKKQLHITILLLAGSIILIKPLLLIPYTHPLTAAFTITFLPGLFAGAIMPYALKMSVRSLKTLGHSYGGLSAAGAIGSVLGTFGTIFLALPLLGATKTLMLLLVLTTIALALMNKWYWFITLALIPFLIITPISITPTPTTAFFEEIDVTLESPYGPVRIYDLRGTRNILVNGGVMSEMNLSNPTQPLKNWEYVECMAYYDSSFTSVYTIGLGGGSLQQRLYEQKIHVVTVDINPVVARAAKEYFVFREGPLMDLRIRDARLDLREDTARYDAIMLDVVHYNDYAYTIPPHLITKEFFTLAKNRLGEDGVLMVHTPFDYDHPIIASVHKTIQEVFTGAEIQLCEYSHVIIASDNHPREEALPGAQLLTDDRVPFVTS